MAPTLLDSYASLPYLNRISSHFDDIALANSVGSPPATSQHSFRKTNSTDRRLPPKLAAFLTSRASMCVARASPMPADKNRAGAFATIEVSTRTTVGFLLKKE